MFCLKCQLNRGNVECSCQGLQKKTGDTFISTKPNFFQELKYFKHKVIWNYSNLGSFKSSVKKKDIVLFYSFEFKLYPAKLLGH